MSRTQKAYWKHSINITIIGNYHLPQTHAWVKIVLEKLAWKQNYKHEIFDGDGLAAKSCPALANLRTVPRQVPLSMAFLRQEYWSGLPFPSPRDLPDSGIKPGCPTLQVDSLPTESPGEKKILLRSTIIPLTSVVTMYITHLVAQIIQGAIWKLHTVCAQLHLRDWILACALSEVLQIHCVTGQELLAFKLAWISLVVSKYCTCNTATVPLSIQLGIIRLFNKYLLSF